MVALSEVRRSSSLRFLDEPFAESSALRAGFLREGFYLCDLVRVQLKFFPQDPLGGRFREIDLLWQTTDGYHWVFLNGFLDRCNMFIGDDWLSSTSRLLQN